MDTAPVARTQTSPARAFAIGVAASAVAVGLGTNDWAGAAIGPAIVGGVAAAVAYVIASRFARRRAIAVGATLAVAIVIAIGQAIRVEQTLRREAWASVFGTASTSRPVGAYDVRRFYAGGPGDRLTLLRFTANPAEIATWVAALPPGDDPLTSVRDGSQSWREWWERFATEPMNRRVPGWENAPSMREPHGYAATNAGAPPIETRTIVWDAATGEAFVVFTEG